MTSSVPDVFPVVVMGLVMVMAANEGGDFVATSVEGVMVVVVWW